MKRSGVTFTEYVFMGLINGYVKYGQFEKANQAGGSMASRCKRLHEKDDVVCEWEKAPFAVDQEVFSCENGNELNKESPEMKLNDAAKGGSTMADGEEEGAETLNRGTDWEVVSLTASAYAASPSLETKENEDGRHGSLEDDQRECAPTLFMSDHFLFPPSEHENLPLLSDDVLLTESRKYISENVNQESQHESLCSSEVHDEYESEVAVPMEMHKLGSGEGETVGSTDDNWDFRRAERSVKHSSESDALHESPFLNEKESLLADDLFKDAPEPEDAASAVYCASDSMKSSNQQGETKGNRSGLPCEAWWKRQAVSLYAQAREANSFWSVLVAAALMGLIILGHRWQQEKLHIQQLKWQFSIADEGLSRMLAHVSRFKDALLGQCRVPVLRRTNSAER